MSYSRTAFAAAVALCAALSSPVAAHAASSASIEVSPAGKRALKQASLTLTTPKLTVGTTTVGSSAKLALNGSLRFKSGRRTASATALSLAIGRTSSYVSARLGKRSVRLLNVTPTRPTQLDAARGSVALTGARIALSPAAAKALRKALKLKRTPSTKPLGTLTASYSRPVRIDNGPIALPAPAATPAPTATPSPTPTTTPAPSTPCDQRLSATPAGSVDWFGCDRPGNGDLKSWTNYLQQDFPPFPCPGGAGSITPAGATRVVADSAYDHRFGIGSVTVQPDGSTTIVTSGSITYRMPVHGIEESIGAFQIKIAADGQTGTVFADGTYKPRDMSGSGCATAPTPYSAQPVFTLDFTGKASVTTGGVRRWVGVPATLTATGKPLVGGGTYTAGTVYSSFTIAIPAP